MIQPDSVEPISPVYHSEIASEGEQATAASGETKWGAASPEVVQYCEASELIKGPSGEEVQAQNPMPSPAMPTQSVRQVHRITHLPITRGAMNALKHFAVKQHVSLLGREGASSHICRL